MDDLTTLKSFRAERDASPERRARPARRSGGRSRRGSRPPPSESLAFGEALAETAPRPRPSAGRRRAGIVRRRRVLAFAAAALLAVVAAGALVLGSGPTAQPASAAEILHEAATAAAASDAPTTLIPGPGQFLYRKEGASSVTRLDLPRAAAGRQPSRPRSRAGR